MLDLPFRVGFEVPLDYVISGRPEDACAQLLAFARSKPIRLTHIYYASDVDVFALLKLEIVAGSEALASDSSRVALAPIRWLTPGTITFIARADEAMKPFDEAAFWNEPQSMETSNMREITSHQVNECNKAIRIFAEVPVPETNAVPAYLIRSFDGHFKDVRLNFQNGPIAEGINGITQEALTAVLIDRLESLQAGPYAHPANAKAIELYKAAAAALLERTQERVERGVEGKHEV